MGHRSLAIVIKSGRALGAYEVWAGTQIFDALRDGPADARGHDGFEPLSANHLATPDSLEAAYLADLDARTLLLFGDPLTAYVGAEPSTASTHEEWEAEVLAAWRAHRFEIRWLADTGELVRYLDRRGHTPRAHAAQRRDAGEASLWEVLARMPEEALEVLSREEEAARGRVDLSEATDRKGGATALLLLLVFAIPALLCRAFLALRGEHGQSGLDEKRSKERADLISKTVALTHRAKSGSLDDRMDLGVHLLGLGFWAEAERELTHVVRALERGERAGRSTLPMTLHNRSIARDALGLKALAKLDRDRAAAGGFRLPRGPAFWHGARSLFRGMAGLD